MLRDEELLPLLRGTKEQLDEAFRKLYDDPDLRRKAFSKMRGATDEEATEIWHDSMADFYVAVLHKRFEAKSSASTYIVRIVINKWLKALEQKARQSGQPIESLPDMEEAPLDLNLADREEEYRQLLDDAVSQLSERCQKMLKDWSDGRTLAFLTEQYEFSSKEIAKKESYRCRERLEKIVHSKPDVLEKLKDWLSKM